MKNWTLFPPKKVYSTSLEHPGSHFGYPRYSFCDCPFHWTSFAWRCIAWHKFSLGKSVMQCLYQKPFELRITESIGREKSLAQVVVSARRTLGYGACNNFPVRHTLIFSYETKTKWNQDHTSLALQLSTSCLRHNLFVTAKTLFKKSSIFQKLCSCFIF